MDEQMRSARLLPAHGNYRELRSFQKAEIVYDFTHRFCKRFVRRGDRTVDQMVQAARSGKQNIEGAKASGTSKEMELKLTNVARRALKNCSRTMKIFSGRERLRSGAKIQRKPAMSAGSAASPA